MDEEEIIEKAKEYTEEYFKMYGGFTCSWKNLNNILKDRFTVEAYLNMQNEELQAKVNKMKCCANCRYWRYNDTCKIDDTGALGDSLCDSWEFKE